MTACICSSKKNVLHSLGKNYDIHSVTQHSWRFDQDHKWAVEPRKSSLAGNAPLQPAVKKISLLGKQCKVNLTPRMFELFQDLWGVEDKPFDSFRDKYKAYVASCRPTNTPPQTFGTWQYWASKPNTAQMLQWQSMPQTAYKVERILLDGVLFRTDKSQLRKGSITDNSCVICHANINYATGKQRRALHRTEKCYGRLQDFYLHFKYPPSKQQLTKAIYKQRIDPAKVGVPYLIVGYCDWYIQLPDCQPITGLTQIKPHPEWRRDCPLVKITDCLSMNVAFWPVDPFSEMTEDVTMVVITHHEEVPVIFNVR